MEATRRKFGERQAVLAVGLMWLACFLVIPSLTGQAQAPNPFEIGVLYYADGSGFKPIDKIVPKVGGRPVYAATIKGAHSPMRLPAGPPQTFRVCGVDPTRYRLYVLKITKNSRTLAMFRFNFWGGIKQVIYESEIPVVIRSGSDNCSTIVPKTPLDNGEYAFSPVDSNDTFPFGVGTVN